MARDRIVHKCMLHGASEFFFVANEIFGDFYAATFPAGRESHIRFNDFLLRGFRFVLVLLVELWLLGESWKALEFYNIIGVILRHR